MSTGTQVEAGTWAIDKVHSGARFSIEHNSATAFTGSFKDIDAKLESGDDGLKISGSVKVESIDLQDPDQTGHVLAPDFFDAERYPTAEYVATAVNYEDGEAVVEGNLTLRGETKPLTVRGTIGEPFTDGYGNNRVPVTLGTTFDRTEYGLNWQMELPNGKPVLGNDVTVEVDLQLIQVTE
ncbi:MAG TPA: YceI family protein [Solirubrobacterales bacterium]|jgi:polyisoprenoid-binding protein YceI|nr:YceI family protein [Solirubrobacterales bacterium]